MTPGASRPRQKTLHWIPEFFEGRFFNLSDSFPRDLIRLGDFLLCFWPRSIKSEASPQNALFSWGKLGKNLMYQPRMLRHYTNSLRTLLCRPSFLDAFSFSEGSAVAGCQPKLRGYIDKSGGFAIPPSFVYATPFKEGQQLRTMKGVFVTSSFLAVRRPFQESSWV